MKKTIMIAVILLSLICIGIAAAADTSAAGTAGEAKFKEHCTVCHPAGGNIVNPKKTLHKKDREENNIKTEADIIRLMRNPGPGMLKFDEKTISPQLAQDIAAYIIKTFK
jgi:cytochrome c6